MKEKAITNKIGTGLKDKRILLITLDSPFLDDQRVFPSLGILYLAAVSAKIGWPVDVTEYFHLTDAADYDVIGISCMTPQGAQANQICRQIKETYPNVLVILGGPHATNYLYECTKEQFDIIVTGDGERVFEGLLTGDVAMLATRLLSESSSEQLIFHDTLTEEEMNTYPIPLRPESHDRYNYNLNGFQATTLVNSRGCPMACGFCESGKTKPRWFSLEHFEAEVQSIVDRGFRGIMIFDDLFALGVEKVGPYLEILKKYNMVFRCFGHAKTMTSEMAAKLKDAGCVEIGFGAESADQGILDTVNKRTTVEQMHAFIETVIGEGMRVKAFFILGLPGETEQTARKTVDFIRKYRTEYPESFTFDLTVFFPYRGTLIGDKAREGNTFDIRPRQGLSWSEIDGNGYGAYKKKKGTSDIVIETSGLSADRIKQIQEETLVLK